MQLVDRRTYRGKFPERTINGYVNDRTIMAIDSSHRTVRYDGPDYFNRTDIRESFQLWVSHDVTEQLPAGEYMTWKQYLQNKKNQKLGIG
jgi:NADH:ubiquinone oxidoreductase subunit